MFWKIMQMIHLDRKCLRPCETKEWQYKIVEPLSNECKQGMEHNAGQTKIPDKTVIDVRSGVD